MNTPPCMSLALMLHEIGHCVDNRNQYKIIGTVNTKVAYNLKYEYDEYIKNTALSLWGEYYAESFAYQIIQSKDDLTLDKEMELEKCLTSFSLGCDRTSLLERSYRVLYYFVIRIAFIHQHSKHSNTFNYSRYEQSQDLSKYIPLLARAEIAILNLSNKYPLWGSYDQLNELSDVFKDFVSFEFARQSGVNS